MTTTEVLLCDQCGGIIPDGASCYKDITATVLLGTGSSINVGPFAFCCTAHAMAKLTNTLYPLAAPDPAYPTLPTS